MSGAMATAAAASSSAASSSACSIAVSSTYSSRKQSYALSSSIPVLSYRTPKFHIYASASLVGFRRLPVWSGLKHLGISLRRSTKEAKCKCRGKAVYASLFGVGAPEALVIGVVALLVFGPKGLAEVARNLGKTLRAFQPTIRELQDVSREFKSTLEREIGLDEVQSTLRSTDKFSTSVNEKPKTVVDSSAIADQETSTDSTTSPESETKAAASEKAAAENATPSVHPTPVPATAESNASPADIEQGAAVSEPPPTVNVPVNNQESQR